jgi:hypothetical protein
MVRPERYEPPTLKSGVFAFGFPFAGLAPLRGIDSFAFPPVCIAADDDFGYFLGVGV